MSCWGDQQSPLQSSGAISFSQIRDKVGLGGEINLNNSKIRMLLRKTSGQLSFSSAHGQSIYYGYHCGQVGENGGISLTVPADSGVYNLVWFGSYGTPDGGCNGYACGWCHSSISRQKVAEAFLGKTSGSIGANNGTFGDPCGGTVKRLYVQIFYGVY